MNQQNTRNFSLYIAPEQKEVLRVLAEESGMNLTEYVDTVLTEAINSRDVFEVIKRKRKRREALSS